MHEDDAYACHTYKVCCNCCVSAQNLCFGQECSLGFKIQARPESIVCNEFSDRSFQRIFCNKGATNMKYFLE